VDLRWSDVDLDNRVLHVRQQTQCRGYSIEALGLGGMWLLVFAPGLACEGAVSTAGSRSAGSPVFPVVPRTIWHGRRRTSSDVTRSCIRPIPPAAD
jgi:hypothetical protein